MPAQRLRGSFGANVPFLVAMMLLTGVSNTILTKFQDNQCVSDCDNPDPRRRVTFEQPVWQTAQMFVGEMGCWLVVGAMALRSRLLRRRGGYEAVATAAALTEGHDGPSAAEVIVPPNLMGHETGHVDQEIAADSGATVTDSADQVLHGFRILLLALPAICDICGTTLMNAGLLLIAASIWQMTRGALVLFVGLFSVIFLRRKLYLYQWLSLAGVVLGVAVVGLAGAFYPDARPVERHDGDGPSIIATIRARVESDDTLKAVIGVLLVAGAQIFTATQFVLEEWILERSSLEPIRVTGWEGVFGFVVTMIGMVTLHFSYGRTTEGQGGWFDMAEGWGQMVHNKQVLVSSFLIMISIGCFNFFGLSVTRSVSATSRSTIDTCRTLFIWIISLFLGWETFKWLQVVGFALLVYSTFVFNGIIRPPLRRVVAAESPPAARGDADEAL